MTSHEFDAYCGSQEFAEPYHEQIAVMHEVELDREESFRQQGAKEALQRLTVTLSALCLREDVVGDYYFGLHTALEVVRGNLGMMKGGVL